MKKNSYGPGVRVFESALYRTNTTVLEWEGGMLVVDPNWLPQEVETIREYVYDRLAGGELWLFFTHADYDHIIGAGAFPDGRILASAAFAAHPDPVAALQQVIDWDQSHYIQRDYPLYFPKPERAVAESGEEVHLAGRTFLAWAAPGHTFDGLMLLDVEAGILLAGDYLSNVEFPFIYDGLAAYHRTLDTFEAVIQTHQPTLLVPGHGDVATTVGEMQRRLAESRFYLAELEAARKNQASFPLDSWLVRYPYPAGLAAEHAKNMLAKD